MAGEVANDGSAFWPRQQTHNMQNTFSTFFAFLPPKKKLFRKQKNTCGKRKNDFVIGLFLLEVVYFPREVRKDFEMYFRKVVVFLLPMRYINGGFSNEKLNSAGRKMLLCWA